MIKDEEKKMDNVEKDPVKELVEAYSRWLEERGYLDDDWWCEEPKAVDEFLKSKSFRITIKGVGNE